VAWNKAFATHLAPIGGHYAEDEATIKKMFEEVKAWVGARYVGYPIGAIFKVQIHREQLRWS